MKRFFLFLVLVSSAFANRYYDPETGIFISCDPAHQFVNAYGYGYGNPINGLDPNGRDWYDFGGDQLSWREGSDPQLKPGFFNWVASLFGGGEYSQS